MNILYEQLKKHFNSAAERYPKHKDTFRAELSLYERAIINREPAAIRVLKTAVTPLFAQHDLLMGDRLDGPREVTDVCNAARRIYRSSRYMP